uniref:Uncharacterized protein n=1 Tax=Alexandrium andersonii TaxID=327968 RepID=A0A7S2AFT4_9DINO|mmetsp:Transcript_11067/g.25199  ORF Transcript_11067/g.25199 Transcript_11067/m.25199 type:complete len:157 (+) Transcript_11067:70-540(+)
MALGFVAAIAATTLGLSDAGRDSDALALLSSGDPVLHCGNVCAQNEKHGRCSPTIWMVSADERKELEAIIQGDTTVLRKFCKTLCVPLKGPTSGCQDSAEFTAADGADAEASHACSGKTQSGTIARDVCCMNACFKDDSGEPAVKGKCYKACGKAE